jgi:hypothetical protein
MHTKARANRATGGLGGWPPGKKVKRRVRINKMLLQCRNAHEARAKRATGSRGAGPQERRAYEG